MRKIIVAGAVGNAIDFYDFIIYGYLASYFAANFFSPEYPVAAMLASYTAFAVGLIMRPIGGILFGNIGDRLSRKSALQWSVILMALPTFLVGLLPTFSDIGIAAPIILFLLRMIQGLAVGGEYGSSMVYLVEKAPINRRGFIGSFISFGSAMGFFLGAAVCLTVTSVIDSASMHAWGWRIPFLLSIILTIIGVIVRRQLIDDKINPDERVSAPVREVIKNKPGAVITLALTSCCVNVSSYVGFVYVVPWLVQQAHIPQAKALSVNMVSIFLCIFISILGGMLSDRIGRIRTIKYAAWFFAIMALPIFQLLLTGELWLMILASILIALGQGIYQGSLAALVVTLFPKNIRVSGVGFSYNLAVGIFGGLSPLIAEYLVLDRQLTLAPAYLLIGGAMISLLTLYISPLWRHSDERLPEDNVKPITTQQLA